MKLVCIEDVITEDGKKAFTKGKAYKGYKSLLKENYDAELVIKAKNDQGERHIIKLLKDERLDKFFQKHFTVAGKGSAMTKSEKIALLNTIHDKVVHWDDDFGNVVFNITIKLDAEVHYVLNQLGIDDQFIELNKLNRGDGFYCLDITNIGFKIIGQGRSLTTHNPRL